MDALTLREKHKLRVFENGAEENVWTEMGEVTRRLEKTAS
jgi:hypothetical protein